PCGRAGWPGAAAPPAVCHHRRGASGHRFAPCKESPRWPVELTIPPCPIASCAGQVPPTVPCAASLKGSPTPVFGGCDEPARRGPVARRAVAPQEAQPPAKAQPIQGAADRSSSSVVAQPRSVGLRQLFTRKWLIENLTSQPFWPLIDQATRIDKEEGTSGRPPLDGSWALFLCVFIFSKEVSLTRFLAKMKRKHWRAIGFDDPPSKSTVWDNLERIELTCLGVFTDAAWLLIRRVDRATGGDVLRDWWWDTTRSLSPSRYYHCCDRDECPKQRIRKQRAQGQAEKRRPKPRRPLRPGQIERAHGLPDDPNADDGEVTSEARAQLRPGQPDPLQNDEDYRKAGSRGVPQLPTRQALIRRLYGEQEAARDAAGLDPEGLVKTTRSPLLLARDALDVERSRIGLCPHSNHAADHYAGLILDYT